MLDAAVIKQPISAINASSHGMLIDPTDQRVERMAETLAWERHDRRSWESRCTPFYCPVED